MEGARGVGTTRRLCRGDLPTDCLCRVDVICANRDLN